MQPSAVPYNALPEISPFSNDGNLIFGGVPSKIPIRRPSQELQSLRDVTESGESSPEKVASPFENVVEDDSSRRLSLTGTRWPRSETLALLKIRSEMDSDFIDSNLRGSLWEIVSRKLKDLGYHRDAKKCREKFENICKYYKKTKERRAGHQDTKSNHFFSQLEALCGGNDEQPPNLNEVLNTGESGQANAVNTAVQELSFKIDPIAGLNVNMEKFGAVNLSWDLFFSSDSSGSDSEVLRKRKRKKKLNKELILFFESLMKQVMEKQDEMQKQFIEMIEKREKDRMIREEAWKQEEMERMKRDNELRAEERSLAASRELALISYMQKMSGQQIHLPHFTKPFPSGQFPKKENDPEQIFDQKDCTLDPSNRKWSNSEVQALIRLRSVTGLKFQDTCTKGLLWEDISAGMASMGYNRSAKRCKEKWENINKYFRRAKGGNKRWEENAKRCPYFYELDTLYKRGTINSGNSLEKNSNEAEEEVSEQASGSTNEESFQGEIFTVSTPKAIASIPSFFTPSEMASPSGEDLK